MKEEILQNLAIAVNVLDQVSVCGKQNRNNLSAGISILEKIAEVIAQADITQADEADQTSDDTGVELE